MQREPLMTAQEVADLVRVHIQTFHRWRRAGLGPRETSIAGKPRYRERDIEAWLDERALAAE